MVLERDVLLAPVLLLRAVERLAWAISGFLLLAHPAAAKPTSKRVRSLRLRNETVVSTGPQCYRILAAAEATGALSTVSTLCSLGENDMA